MKHLLCVAMIGVSSAIGVFPPVASAQTPPQTTVPSPGQTPTPPSAPPKLLTYRGMQLGFDVTAAREGEFGIYWGASSTRSVLAVRFAAMDEGEAVSCSVGVMYEYLFRTDRTRITPVAGASLSRVFSCASDSDGARPSPDVGSAATFSAGVRVPIFAGHRTVGALKVLAFSQRQFGSTPANDTSSQGVTIGFVIGRR